MKKPFSLMLMGILFMLVLAGCGSKSQQEVVADMDKKLEKLQGYKANASVVLNAGEEPKKFNVEVWHKKPDHYLISLTNEKETTSQMILKNNEGVFVLTPHLNKSYRFQSDWPQNGSQWYLYESLVRDILNDSDREFTTTDGNYVFQTKTNYDHKDLQTQKITLSKKELKPVAVQIMGQDDDVLVDMKFDKVNFNPEFEEGAFDLQRNMTSAQLEVPVMAQQGDESLNVFYPLNMPAGSELKSAKEFNTENGKKVVLQYTGEKSFTIIEQSIKASESSTKPVMASGEPVNLGHAIGTMSENAISWTYNGTDFMLASNDLSQSEMIDLASSVYGKAMK
jgi:outer membrane lipoprotein-sorting protein